MKKVIYDIGANNGDDISYYLLKADVVVAIEANPALCDLISTRFRTEILTGRLFVENCVVVNKVEAPIVDFYLHRYLSVLSQFPVPSPNDLERFTKVELPAKAISEIVAHYGSPHYIKIDVEHYDAQVLKALFEASIFPPFISAEAHSIEVFFLLVTQGSYNSFKLVDGNTVSDKYGFPIHSAGPFGADVAGNWLNEDDLLILLALEGLGWKDIHATRLASPPLPKLGFLSKVLRYFSSNLGIFGR